MDISLQNELEARISEGNKPLQIKEISAKLKALGYKLDRTMDCSSTASWMSGPREGATYPVTTSGVMEIDTRRSAFHFESRRDANFNALQALRFEGTYAISRGRILEF